MEITKADVHRPLADLVNSNKEKVVVEDCDDYHIILLTIEDTVLFNWQNKQIL